MTDKHTIRPIVEHATYTVRCACGFGCDSSAESADAALDEVKAKHRCAEPDFTAKEIAR